MKRLLLALMLLAFPVAGRAVTYTVAWNGTGVASLNTANTEADSGDVVVLAAGGVNPYPDGIAPVAHGITYKSTATVPGTSPELYRVPSINLNGKRRISVKGVTSTGNITCNSSSYDSLQYVTGLSDLEVYGSHYCYFGNCIIGDDGVGDQWLIGPMADDTTSYCEFEHNTFNIVSPTANYASTFQGPFNSTFHGNLINQRLPNAATVGTDVGIAPRYAMRDCAFSDNKTVTTNNNENIQGSPGYPVSALLLRDGCRFNSWTRDTFLVSPSSTYPVRYRFAQTGSYDGMNKYNSFTDCFFQSNGPNDAYKDPAYGYGFTGNVFVMNQSMDLYADSCTFRHNTFTSTGLGGLIGCEAVADARISNSIFASNIFYGNGTAGSVPIPVTLCGSSGNSLDSNLVYSTNSAATAEWLAWAADSSSNSHYFNPEFVDPSWASMNATPMNDSVGADELWADGYVGAIDPAGAPTTHVLTTTIVPSGWGSVTRDPDEVSYSHGVAVQLTAVPDNGYRFSSWSGDASGALDTVTVLMTGNRAVTANFAAISCTLTVVATNGSVTRWPNNGPYAYGTLVALSAVDANLSYTFDRWTGVDSSSGRSAWITTTANDTVVASFVQRPYTVAVTVVGPGSVTRFPNRAFYYRDSTVRLTAGADSGATFLGWYGGTNDTTLASPKTNPLTIPTYKNRTLTANFAVVADSIWLVCVFNHGSVQIYVDGNWPPPPDTVFTQTDSLCFSEPHSIDVGAYPDPGWKWYRTGWTHSWDKAPEYMDEGVGRDINFNELIQNTILFFEFIPIYSNVTLTYVAGTNGSIVGDNPQTIPAGTSGTEVVATPDAHYHFVSWSDGSTVAARTDEEIVTDTTFTASFAIDTYTLNYTAGVGGTISGSTTQTVAYGGSGTQVTAVANRRHSTKYHFVQWDDGLTTESRTDTNVTTNASYQALFSADKPEPPAIPVKRKRGRISDCVEP